VKDIVSLISPLTRLTTNITNKRNYIFFY